MACNKYHDIAQELLNDPDKKIPKAWENHAEKCAQCQIFYNKLIEEKNTDKFIKESFKKYKLKLESEYKPPVSLAYKTKEKISDKIFNIKRFLLKPNILKIIVPSFALLLITFNYLFIQKTSIKEAPFEIARAQEEKEKTINPGSGMIKKNEKEERKPVLTKKIQEKRRVENLSEPESPPASPKPEFSDTGNDNFSLESKMNNETENNRLALEPSKEKRKRENKKSAAPAIAMSAPQETSPAEILLEDEEKKEFKPRLIEEREKLKKESKKLWDEIIKKPEDLKKRKKLREILEKLNDKEGLKKLNKLEESYR
ncbi:MAG: hypothetical protein OEZ13_02335 [Spirochaetia bacterium]|nr:hypothetical protein [Spirochaetia bacterium]